ncbi:uncharacterized protein AMSG_11164 [Thecamonas trahens ATCC 50062]|uniref:Uncharacterized protein n=1 Tax=Thecamonas trahens ATCC 50062 TaxID=461836 RepID=A0A0L0DU35_THETB|nr:hypothetical protein AMSG_11164 [Thecamonas trahens ATCC 50062]KNC55707.1 hypothetical protein AMSG_11164 [Thecamonas trahens ATCC 50062]|eukprot:XP_013752918.1 hypothetical protein AMSG_11164 [Thecamonas trahens ATCC 50062]
MLWRALTNHCLTLLCRVQDLSAETKNCIIFDTIAAADNACSDAEFDDIKASLERDYPSAFTANKAGLDGLDMLLSTIMSNDESVSMDEEATSSRTPSITVEWLREGCSATSSVADIHASASWLIKLEGKPFNARVIFDIIAGQRSYSLVVCLVNNESEDTPEHAFTCRSGVWAAALSPNSGQMMPGQFEAPTSNEPDPDPKAVFRRCKNCSKYRLVSQTHAFMRGVCGLGYESQCSDPPVTFIAALLLSNSPALASANGEVDDDLVGRALALASDRAISHEHLEALSTWAGGELNKRRPGRRSRKGLLLRPSKSDDVVNVILDMAKLFAIPHVAGGTYLITARNLGIFVCDSLGLASSNFRTLVKDTLQCAVPAAGGATLFHLLQSSHAFEAGRKHLYDSAYNDIGGIFGAAFVSGDTAESSQDMRQVLTTIEFESDRRAEDLKSKAKQWSKPRSETYKSLATKLDFSQAFNDQAESLILFHGASRLGKSTTQDVLLETSMPSAADFLSQASNGAAAAFVSAGMDKDDADVAFNFDFPAADAEQLWCAKKESRRHTNRAGSAQAPFILPTRCAVGHTTVIDIEVRYGRSFEVVVEMMSKEAILELISVNCDDNDWLKSFVANVMGKKKPKSFRSKDKDSLAAVNKLKELINESSSSSSPADAVLDFLAAHGADVRGALDRKIIVSAPASSEPHIGQAIVRAVIAAANRTDDPKAALVDSDPTSLSFGSFEHLLSAMCGLDGKLRNSVLANFVSRVTAFLPASIIPPRGVLKDTAGTISGNSIVRGVTASALKSAAFVVILLADGENIVDNDNASGTLDPFFAHAKPWLAIIRDIKNELESVNGDRDAAISKLTTMATTRDGSTVNFAVVMPIKPSDEDVMVLHHNDCVTNLREGLNELFFNQLQLVIPDSLKEHGEVPNDLGDALELLSEALSSERCLSVSRLATIKYSSWALNNISLADFGQASSHDAVVFADEGMIRPSVDSSGIVGFLGRLDFFARGVIQDMLDRVSRAVEAAERVLTPIDDNAHTLISNLVKQKRKLKSEAGSYMAVVAEADDPSCVVLRLGSADVKKLAIDLTSKPDPDTNNEFFSSLTQSQLHRVMRSRLTVAVRQLQITVKSDNIQSELVTSLATTLADFLHLVLTNHITRPESREQLVSSLEDSIQLVAVRLVQKLIKTEPILSRDPNAINKVGGPLAKLVEKIVHGAKSMTWESLRKSMEDVLVNVLVSQPDGLNRDKDLLVLPKSTLMSTSAFRHNLSLLSRLIFTVFRPRAIDATVSDLKDSTLHRVDSFLLDSFVTKILWDKTRRVVMTDQCAEFVRSIMGKINSVKASLTISLSEPSNFGRRFGAPLVAACHRSRVCDLVESHSELDSGSLSFAIGDSILEPPTTLMGAEEADAVLRAALGPEPIPSISEVDVTVTLAKLSSPFITDDLHLHVARLLGNGDDATITSLKELHLALMPSGTSVDELASSEAADVLLRFLSWMLRVRFAVVAVSSKPEVVHIVPSVETGAPEPLVVSDLHPYVLFYIAPLRRGRHSSDGDKELAGWSSLTLTDDYRMPLGSRRGMPAASDGFQPTTHPGKRRRADDDGIELESGGLEAMVVSDSDDAGVAGPSTASHVLTAPPPAKVARTTSRSADMTAMFPPPTRHELKPITLHQFRQTYLRARSLAQYQAVKTKDHLNVKITMPAAMSGPCQTVTLSSSDFDEVAATSLIFVSGAARVLSNECKILQPPTKPHTRICQDSQEQMFQEDRVYDHDLAGDDRVYYDEGVLLVCDGVTGDVAHEAEFVSGKIVSSSMVVGMEGFRRLGQWDITSQLELPKLAWHFTIMASLWAKPVIQRMLLAKRFNTAALNPQDPMVRKQAEQQWQEMTIALPNAVEATRNSELQQKVTHQPTTFKIKRQPSSSSTLLTAAITGTKLSVFVAGDSRLMVIRWNETTRQFEPASRQSITPELLVKEPGRDRMIPSQLWFQLRSQDGTELRNRHVSHVAKVPGHSKFHCDIQVGDIVIAGSDGVWAKNKVQRSALFEGKAPKKSAPRHWPDGNLRSYTRWFVGEQPSRALLAALKQLKETGEEPITAQSILAAIWPLAMEARNNSSKKDDASLAVMIVGKKAVGQPVHIIKREVDDNGRIENSHLAPSS